VEKLECGGSHNPKQKECRKNLSTRNELTANSRQLSPSQIWRSQAHELVRAYNLCCLPKPWEAAQVLRDQIVRPGFVRALEELIVARIAGRSDLASRGNNPRAILQQIKEQGLECFAYPHPAKAAKTRSRGPLNGAAAVVVRIPAPYTTGAWCLREVRANVARRATTGAGAKV